MNYVLDACAVMAVILDEPGSNIVTDIYKRASVGDATLIINKINLLEVYCNIVRKFGKGDAVEFIEKFNQSPTIVIDIISNDIFTSAGHFKTSYRMSFADSIALAQSVVSDGVLLTSDHHEFDAVEKNGEVKFLWIR